MFVLFSDIINCIPIICFQVKLLASPNSSVSKGLLVDLNNSNSKSLDETDKDKKDEESSQLTSENEVSLLKGNTWNHLINLKNIHYYVLTEKLQRFESLLVKCKENIKNQIERNNELQTQNEALKKSEAQKSAETDTLQVKD